jgi:hypothetical protein
MPQSERLSAHALLDEVEENPILRKKFTDIIIKELEEEAELKNCIIGVIKKSVACFEEKQK